MCNYKTLNNNQHGYVVQCNGCNHLQVAFGTLILSLTTDEFFELIDRAEYLYDMHKMHAPDDRKIIKIPTGAKAITMVFSLKELKDFIHLLRVGGNRLQYGQLFVFNEN